MSTAEASAWMTAVKPIKVTGLMGIVFTPNSKTAYVLSALNSERNRGTVAPIQTATNKPGKAIKVKGSPNYIAITP